MGAADPLRVEFLDAGPMPKRRRRFGTKSPSGVELLPAEWRSLLAKWARRGGKSRWETLLKDAGTAQLTLANSLLDWLLREGWAVIIEEHKRGDWWPLWLELRELPALRAALGLNDKESDARHWETRRTELAALNDAALAPVLLALDELPVHRALGRHDLAQALSLWKSRQQSGTRRDFAFFARGETKAVTDAEWAWLEAIVDLAEFGIERHTPLLLLSAPLVLHLTDRQLDLSVCADFAALTPATIEHVTRVDRAISCWHVVENRTSFERVARQRHPEAGVIWLPGFPPGWWREAVARLLDFAPAPARISCDPDPAGIAIAMQASELWEQRQLGWQPWRMGTDDLSGLRARKALSALDRDRLGSLLDSGTLPSALGDLARWMMAHGEKGEQEGYL